MSTSAPEPVDTPPTLPPAPQDPAAPAIGPNGYPLETKPEAMSAEHAAAYWRHEARRQQDFNKANTKRIKELEPAAQQVAALEEASRTEAEKVAIKAREDGEKAGRQAALAEARETYGAQLVETKLKAAAEKKGLTEDAILKLAGKPARFLGDEGVDDGALGDFLAALPDKTTEPAPAGPPRLVRDIGGGHRPTGTPNAVVSGATAYAARHGKTPAQ